MVKYHKGILMALWCNFNLLARLTLTLWSVTSHEFMSQVNYQEYVDIAASLITSTGENHGLMSPIYHITGMSKSLNDST